MAYNMTQLAQSETVYDLLVYANTATGDILLVLLVMAVFFVMLMVLKKWEFEKGLLVSSFVCFMISIMLVYGHLIQLVWALVFLVIAAFTALYMTLSKG